MGTMSKRVEVNIQCPDCGHRQNAVLFRSLWIEDGGNRSLLLNDKVNVFICDKCEHTERLEYPFLCTNVNKGLAIWYEPYHDGQIDADVEMYRKHMGPNSFYAKAPRIADWNAFKAKFLEMEAAGPQLGQEPIRSRESQEAFKGFVDSLKEKGPRSPEGASMQKLSASTFEQLRDEAEGGSMQAQYTLGGAYYNGNGVERNREEGARWLQKAAGQGHIAAQCDLGVMYQKGMGVEQDYQTTLKWFRKAAEQGDALAQHNLWSLHAKGFKIKGMGFFNSTAFGFMKATQDFVEAYKWYSLAAANGHSLSLKDRAIIKMRMSAAQISKAEGLVREFQQEKNNTESATACHPS